MEEARLYHGLSLGLLHVLFLQVSVLLLHTVLAELRAHISNTHINVRIELLGLDQAIHELPLLMLLLALSHDRLITL